MLTEMLAQSEHGWRVSAHPYGGWRSLWLHFRRCEATLYAGGGPSIQHQSPLTLIDRVVHTQLLFTVYYMWGAPIIYDQIGCMDWCRLPTILLWTTLIFFSMLFTPAWNTLPITYIQVFLHICDNLIACVVCVAQMRWIFLATAAVRRTRRAAAPAAHSASPPPSRPSIWAAAPTVVTTPPTSSYSWVERGEAARRRGGVSHTTVNNNSNNNINNNAAMPLSLDFRIQIST